MIENNNFDDYLDLLSYDFSKYKYIFFVGNSGSGKSTYIKKLIKENSSLNKNIIVIDELFDIFDIFKYFFKFFSNNQFIIASHISVKYIYIFRVLGKIKKIETDKHYNKICNYLQCKNLIFSDNIINKYIKSFSSTYTDIDIILENYKGNDFDEAFYKFVKFNKISLSGNKNNK